MSGYSENLVSHQGILDADVALIEKPFAEESLLQRIRTILDDGSSTKIGAARTSESHV